MKLSEKQQLFTKMVARLIDFATSKGYGLTFGEAFRTPEMAAIHAARGKGIKHSLHSDRLAVDFNLFIDGEYKADTESHRPIGEFWESIGGAWGGRFNDGNHYSLEHNGRK
jgi:hypothetical protein